MTPKASLSTPVSASIATRRAAVATITLDDPAKMNRVPLAARGQLAHLFAELAGTTPSASS